MHHFNHKNTQCYRVRFTHPANLSLRHEYTSLDRIAAFNRKRVLAQRKPRQTDCRSYLLKVVTCSMIFVFSYNVSVNVCKYHKDLANNP